MENYKTSLYYTCFGSVRGECGIKHRTAAAAAKCCAKDQAGIRRAYPSTFPCRAYSDRSPRAVENGETRHLNEQEQEQES